MFAMRHLIFIPILILIFYPVLINQTSTPERIIKVTPFRQGKTSAFRENIQVSQKVGVTISRKTPIGYRKILPEEDTYLMGLYVLPKKFDTMNRIVLWTSLVSTLLIIGRKIMEVKFTWK